MDELAGAGVFILQGDVVTNLHANILRRFRSDYAGEFLYWSVIERYCRKGFKVFDLGRSLIGSGNETFKMKWKPRKQLLAYWYALDAGSCTAGIESKESQVPVCHLGLETLASFYRAPAWTILDQGTCLSSDGLSSCVELSQLDEDGLKRLAVLHHSVMHTLLSDLGLPDGLAILSGCA